MLLMLLALFVGWGGMIGAFFPADDVDRLAIVTSDGHVALFVSESVSHYMGDDSDDYWTTRLAVYDLATGQRTSRRVVQWPRPSPAGLTALGPAPGGHWFYDTSEGITVLDAQDGSVVRSTADLLSADQREHLLRSGPLEERLGHLIGEQAVVMTLDDGTRIRVQADSSEGAPYGEPMPPFIVERAPGTATVIRLDDGRVVRLDHGESDPLTSVRLTESGATFLRGFLVTASGRVLLAPEPESVFVMHTSSAEVHSAPLLSRVRLDDGGIVFTSPIGASGQLLLARTVDDAIVLIRRDGSDVMLCGYGLSDGAERFRVDLD